MNRLYTTNPQWSTSSFGSPAETSPMELATLGRHLVQCSGQRGMLSRLRCAGEAMNEFVASRLMTTLALFALLAVAAALVS